MTLDLIGPILVLALVVALLLVALWGVRKLSFVAHGVGGEEVAPRLLARTLVGPKQGIALVKIGDHVFATSFGDGGVHVLHAFSMEESEKLLQRASAAGSKSFREHFATVFKRSNSTD